MPLGVNLQELTLQLRAELGLSANPGHGITINPVHRQKLARVQRALWLDHGWPHLRVDRDVPLAAGQRQYDFPDDLDFNRVEGVAVRYGDTWRPLCRDVGTEQMNAWDSDRDRRADPALRWDMVGGQQFEVWPVPVADGAQIVRIRGIRNLAPLVDDNDTCDIDADLIVLTAASELADSKSGQDTAFARRAAALYNRLKSRGETRDGPVFNMGGRPGGHDRWPRQAPPLVAVDRGR